MFLTGLFVLMLAIISANLINFYQKISKKSITKKKIKDKIRNKFRKSKIIPWNR